MRSMRSMHRAFALAIVALAVTTVSAQTGGLRIKVFDETASPLPGATVTLSNEQGYVKTTSVVSDASGVALFPVLRPGAGYRVDVSFPTYTPSSKADLHVRISKVSDVEVQLIRELQETIRVEDKADIVDLDKSDTTTTFNSDFIQDLPVPGRFYQNVLTLAPGVSDSDGDGNPNVHGARDRDFKAQVNGISNQDPLTGQFLSLVNPDSIEEIEVVTAGAGAEYGRAQGGFANIIQKQGSNDFEGVANMVFRSSKLDGNGATSIDADRLPDFEVLQPSVQISGPILKDKLWYRFSHEYHKIDEPRNTIGAVVPVTTTRFINDDVITWQASPRNKLSFQFRFDPQTVENFGINSRVPVESSFGFENGGPTYSVAWIAPFSTKLLVNSTVAFQDHEFKILPTTTGVANDCLVAGSDEVTALVEARCFNAETGNVSGSFFLTHEDTRQRLTVRSDGSFYAGRLWGVEQQFEFGTVVENERYTRTLDRRPTLTFFLLQPQTEEGGTPQDVDRVGIGLGRFAIPRVSEARATGVSYALYGADKLNLLPNLNLTVGLRLYQENINSKGIEPFYPDQEGAEFLRRIAAGEEPTSVPPAVFTAYEGIADLAAEFKRLLNLSSEAAVQLAPIVTQTANWPKQRRLDNIAIQNTNIEPKLAVTWDPFKDGKTKLSATAGRYYDKIFLTVPLIELEPPTFDTRFLAQRVGGHYRVSELGQINPSSANISLVSRDLATPYKDEYTIGIEREILPETTLSVKMIRSRFRDQLQDIELNHLPGDFGRCFPSGRGFIVQPSPGEGGQFVDAFTGEPYTDTDPGEGDGRLDDCAGELAVGEVEPGQIPFPDDLFQRPDGLADTYVQNPAWGEVFLVGNYNSTKYTAYQVELVRRQHRNWQMEASYVWSKAIGDAEDFNTFEGDDRTLLDDERGYLRYDRRHAVKVNATTITPWGFRVGTAVQWLSGEPYSILITRLAQDTAAPVYGGLLPGIEPRVRRKYVTGQRNDQRNRAYWTFDINAAKEYNLKGGLNLQLRAEIYNLFNKDTLHILDQFDGFNAAFRDFGRSYQLTTRLAF